MPVKVVETEYKGYPMLEISWDGTEPDTRPLNLGISKAKKVLQALEQIRAFVEAHKNDRRRPYQQQTGSGTGRRGESGTPVYGNREPTYRS